MKTLVLNDSTMNIFNAVNAPDDSYTLIIKNGEPVGLFTSFSNELLKTGLIKWLVIKAFQSGDISLGQLSKQLNQTKTETIDFLGNLNIPVLDYELEDDLRTIEKWNNENNS